MKQKIYYDVGNETICSAEVLKSSLCDYSDAYILVMGDIITTAHNIPTPVAFKIWAAFIKCIKKIDGTTVDDAEDLDLSMLMYNFLEYSLNYSDMVGSLWFYSKNETTVFDSDIANNNWKILYSNEG